MSKQIVKDVSTLSCAGTAPCKGKVALSFLTTDGSYSLIEYTLGLPEAEALSRELVIAISIARGELS